MTARPMSRFKLSRLLAILLALTLAPFAAHAAGPFDDWAGVFVAGDYRAHSGVDSEVFDNGRRDVAKAFVEAGLKRENTIQFSVRPERYADTPEKPFAAVPAALGAEMTKLTARAQGGCVFFYTSHGAPQGVVMGAMGVAPRGMAQLIDATCGDRPSLVIISACFSGVFVPALSGPNRVVMTAARRDRSSFGCGESDVYTFFDTCLLEELPQAPAFDVLGERVRACVEKRETAMGLSPASEPQMTVGETIKAAMKTYALARSYKVKPGDTLAKISEQMYGETGRASAIFEANKGVLRRQNAAPTPGQTLKIPPA